MDRPRTAVGPAWLDLDRAPASRLVGAPARGRAAGEEPRMKYRTSRVCQSRYMETATQILHRLTSYEPGRPWDAPADDPRVVQDLQANDPARRPWYFKRYPQPLPDLPLPDLPLPDLPLSRLPLPRDLPST